MKTTYKNSPIAFTSQGTGNPLVLLHGFLESKEIWKDFSEELSATRQVICIDLPGHGESGNIAPIHSMAEMAKAVKAVFEELQIENAFFAGHSMGGYVSLEFQNIFPTIPTGLALINSTPVADSPERRKNRERATQLVQKNKKAFVSMAISNLLTPENNHKLKPEVEILKKRALTFSKEAIMAALQGMKIRTDHTELLRAYTKPKFIICGENDPVLDFKTIKNIANYCNSDFISYPDGHLSFLENKTKLMRFMHFIEKF